MNSFITEIRVQLSNLKKKAKQGSIFHLASPQFSPLSTYPHNTNSPRLHKTIHPWSMQFLVKKTEIESGYLRLLFVQMTCFLTYYT